MITRKQRLAILAIASAMGLAAGAVEPNGIKIYLNPGHGGHESNDRNVVIEPYKQGDPEGYWESNSNLTKALFLRDMLEAKGYTVVMSRVTNTEDDDLKLSTIWSLANQSGADLFFSIHSNATGTVNRVNFPLMLYRGWDDAADNPEDKVVATILNRHLLENESTYWTDASMNIRGDWSFYNWGYKVGLGVLSGLKVTGMLSEGSFHDYIPETYRLMDDDFCRLEAWHFRRAIDEYFGQPGETVGQIAGRINDSRLPREGNYAMKGDDRFATVQNATVELYDNAGNKLADYTTDAIHPNGLYAFRDVEPGKYTLKVSAPTHYPTEAEIEVKADAITYNNFKMDRVRDTPPEVVSYSPVWNEGDEELLCNTPIVLNFNWDMDTEATEGAFSIEPPVKGTFTWSDLNYTVTFTPSEPYAISTDYTVRLNTTAKHAGDMALKESFSFSFRTTDSNYLEILGYFPTEGAEVHYNNARVEMRLEKAITTNTVTSQVHCTDSKGNEVRFSTRGKEASTSKAEYGWFRLPFASALTVGEQYTLTFDGTISDKDGITIQKPVTVQFTAVDASTPIEEEWIAPSPAETSLSLDEERSEELTAASVTFDSSNALYADELCPTLNYEFTGAEGGDVIWSRQQPEGEPVLTPGAVLHLSVYGDLSGNELMLECVGETAMNYQKICDLDFLGWRNIDVAASSLEGPSRWTGIRIVQLAGLASRKGAVKVQRLYTGTESGITDAVSDSFEGVSVRTSPDSDFLVANADCTIVSVELFDLSGAAVAKASGNILRVSGLQSGTYICRVNTAGGAITLKTIVY